MTETNGKKNFNLPHVYVLLLTVMLIALILTYLVPSGEFVRNVDPTTGRTIIDPNSFTLIEKTHLTLMDYFKAIHKGIVSTADIIVMLIFVAASIMLVDATGAITAGVQAMLSKFKGMDTYILIFVVFLFAFFGAIGMAEGAIAFIPLAVSIAIGMGYDRMVGAAAGMLGLSAGFTSGVLNIYTTGVGQSILKLPLFSGMEFRIFSAVVFSTVVAGYVLSYAKKIKKDPSSSLLADEYVSAVNTSKDDSEKVELTTARMLILLALVCTLGFQIYGTLKLKWYLTELSAIYIMLGIVAGLLAKMTPSQIAVQMAKGASIILPAGLAVGIARSVLIIMEQGKILDTAIHSLAGSLQGHSPLLVVMLLYATVILFNFFVTSGSGKAVILMPILGPLGQFIGINQQVMVVAYQFGDGFTNYLWPTSGVLMASLAIANISWEAWFKFSWKIFIVLTLLGAVMTAIAQLINLGPF